RAVMPAISRRIRKVLSLLLTGLFLGCLLPAMAGATGLTPRTWQQLDSSPGVLTDYTLTFTVSNNITLGSLSVLLCANDPVESDPCDIPTGLDVTNAQLTAQNGITDFNLFVADTNDMILSRPAATAVTAPQTVSLTFHN